MTDLEFPIVAIGASAGGLTALETFFRESTPGTNMAYIVIQHLSPDFRSLMDQLLARHTDIPVLTIEDGLRVECNHIYLLPPGKEAYLHEGKVYLKDRSPARELNFPIDEFFRTLARDAGARAIAIVMSGTGTDGSRGIQDVHVSGGLVISQDEDSADFNGMPRSARATGVVDMVLTPEAMPAALRQFRDNPEAIRNRLRQTSTSHSLDYMAPSMRRILGLLNSRYGLDFTHYKAPSIARRVERRMSLGGQDLEAYANDLEVDPELLEQLYSDLLIGVTSFFRDREVWESLELSVLPQLISRLKPDEEFRAWVAGAATGEEAYSLAILLIEVFEKLGRPCNARIFASDVHEEALNKASHGFYSPDRVDGILPERRSRFFEERPEGYRVCGDVRKLVVFTPHNVIHDAPFTRLDLVTCRNVLIYLNMATQQKSLALMGFGLKQNGVLCLGASESLGELHRGYETIDPQSRIYRKLADVRTSAPAFRPPGLQSVLSNALKRAKGNAPVNEMSAANPANLLATYDRVLADFMPPGLLVTRSRQLVHAFNGASKFMVARDGRPTGDVLDTLDPSIKPAVAAAIRRVCRDKKRVSYPGIDVRTRDGREIVQLLVIPYCNETDIEHVLVLFASRLAEDQNPVEEIHGTPAVSEEIEALDRELQITRENLQSSIEELQATNEQHQGANEELTAANEELQSTNEELHSVNEELYTVNAEHQRKIDELTELTDDMDNLLTTTNVHTLFLDRELRLRRFTPRIAEFFNLIPQDVGRRIESFTNNLLDDDLVTEIRGVIETEEPFEREVCDHRGLSYLLRIFPYIARGSVEGAVLTLVDITSMTQASEALRSSEERFNLAVRGSNEGIWDWQDVSQEYIWCSPRFYKLLGYDAGSFEMTFSFWKDLLHEDDHDRVVNAFEAHLQTSAPFDEECRMECEDGQYRWFHCCGAAKRDATGNAIRMAGSLEDITERRVAQDEVRDAVERRDQFLAMLSHELRNPLGAIRNAVQLLDSDHVNDAKAVVKRQVAQMARLLDDLLDVSRITHGKLDLVCEPLDIVKLVEHAMEAVPALSESEPLEDKTISIELPDEPVFINGDSARLEQVVVNLVGNAIKYTPQGGDVAVSVQVIEGHAEIEVRDTGIGIPPEQLDSIFEMFVQSDKTIHRSNGGMGVGLTLVKSVIDMHNGTVTARSEGRNKGSCFVVRLPLTTLPVRSAEADRSTPEKIQRVVIVEDIEDARRMLQLLLEGRGYEVASAADGSDGLKLIQETKPDVALIDIGLPGLSGFQIAEALRADPHFDEVKLVALTGYGQSNDRVSVAQAGFDEHLVKPLKIPELARALSPRVPFP